jgi:hypothetical protein
MTLKTDDWLLRSSNETWGIKWGHNGMFLIMAVFEDKVVKKYRKSYAEAVTIFESYVDCRRDTIFLEMQNVFLINSTGETLKDWTRENEEDL